MIYPSKKITILTLATLIALSSPIAFSKEVRIYNWSDYIDPELISKFTNETGIKVIYDTFDSNEILLAKTLTGNSGYDIVVPSTTAVKYLIQADRALKIDWDKIPNHVNIWPYITQKVGEIEELNDYSIPYMWGTTGIAYNVDMIEALVPDAPLDSMEILFNPQYASKLAKCGIYILDSPSEMYPLPLLYLGYDANSMDLKHYDDVTELFQNIRLYIKKFHSSENINAIANGDACLVVGWSGDIYMAKARAKESNAGVKIEYIIPKEGTILWFDQFTILKDGPNIDEAYQFINFMLDAKNNAQAANYLEYATSNEAAFEYVRDDLLSDSILYPSQEFLERLSPVYPKTQREQKMMNSRFLNLKNYRPK